MAFVETKSSAGSASIRYGGVWKENYEARLRLETQVAAYEQQVAQYENDVEHVTNQSNEYEKQVAELQQRIADMETKMQEKNKALQHVRNQMNGLEMSLQTAETKNTLAHERQMELEQRVAAQQAEINQLEHEKDQLNEAMNASTQECDQLRDLLYNAQEQVQYQEETIDKQARRLEVLERAQSSKDRQVQALIKERDALSRKIAQMRVTSTTATRSSRTKATTQTTPLSPTSINKQLQALAEEQQQTIAESASTVKHPSDPNVAPLLHSLRSMKTKLQQEQQENGVLREQIKRLELDQKDLIARFRQATIARKRAERNMAQAS